MVMLITVNNYTRLHAKCINSNLINFQRFKYNEIQERCQTVSAHEACHTERS